MKRACEVIDEMVNAKLIEEVSEYAVSDASHLILDQMAVSIAISLKRIADALDGTTLGVDISEGLAGLTLKFMDFSRGTA